VVPFPSSVLHSTENAVTKILVPGFTVHESTPLGPNGATVPPPRFQHPNAAPPVPNEFWADGVSSTVVHNAVRSESSFVGGGAALAAGAAARAAQAANRPTASPRIPNLRDHDMPARSICLCRCEREVAGRTLRYVRMP
jgi:hypothetical protein